MEDHKLGKLDVSRLHHAEMGQIAVRYFEDFVNSGANANYDPDYKKLHTKLQALLPDYKLALDQVQANEESKAIATADKHRDDDYKALYDALRPYRSTRGAAEKAAYATIRILMNQYSGVDANAYEEETLRLNNLVATLSEPAYADAAAVLNLQKFITNLQTSNAAFNDLFAHRSTQVSQKISYDVKAMRRVLEAAYRKLANYLETMVGVKDEPFYTETLAVLNTGRKYFSDTVARRSGGAEEKPKS